MRSAEAGAAGAEACSLVDQGPAQGRVGQTEVLASVRRQRGREDAGAHLPVLEGGAGPLPRLAT